jgi:hypothetical protein
MLVNDVAGQVERRALLTTSDDGAGSRAIWTEACSTVRIATARSARVGSESAST